MDVVGFELTTAVYQQLGQISLPLSKKAAIEEELTEFQLYFVRGCTHD
jgi:hypothetical protein